MQTVQKYMFYGATALFVYMPFHIFIAFWLSSLTGGLDMWKVGKDVFTALLVVVSVSAVVYAKKHTRIYLWLLGLTVVYLALHLLILLATNQPYDTGLLATAYNLRLFGYAIIGYSVALLVPKQFNSRYLSRILIAITFVVCFFAILQRILPTDILSHFGYSVERGVKPMFFIDDKPDLPRVMSTLRDPNSLGAFLILPSTIVLLALFKYWKTERRMMLLGLLCLFGWVNILTFSRSAWLGMLLTHIVAAVFVFRKHIISHAKKYLPVIVLAIFLLAVGFFALRDQYFVQNVVFHSDESTQLDNPQELRVSLVQKGLDGVADNPEGNGPGTAGLVSVHNEKGGLLPENYFVQIAYEVGIFGLLVFLALLYLILSELWRRRRDPIAQALLASFIGLTLMNMLLMTWANEAVACGWFMLAGTTLILPISKRK